LLRSGRVLAAFTLSSSSFICDRRNYVVTDVGACLQATLLWESRASSLLQLNRYSLGVEFLLKERSFSTAILGSAQRLRSR